MTTADKLLITLLVAHEYYHSKSEDSENSGEYYYCCYIKIVTLLIQFLGSDVFISPPIDDYQEQVNTEKGLSYVRYLPYWMGLGCSS